MSNKHPKDFFGNDIEVGDEVAWTIPRTDMMHLATVVTVAEKTVRLDKKCTMTGRPHYVSHHKVIVNTEKKHREKALDYLAAEAQEMGGYDVGVGITTLKEGFEETNLIKKERN